MGLMTLFIRGAGKLAKWGGPVIIGMLALSAIVWFVGPRLGLRDPLLRLYVILGILAVGILALLIQWLIVRRRGKKMKSEAASEDPEAAQREAEKQALRDKTNEAVKSLKGSELAGGNKGAAALYALPWYLIIGPSAAGKSTLLGNSGLHFPYASSEDLQLRGLGGTRNCDWWFADEAILLDTAGRYTTEEDDHDEWMTFLDLIRRHRKRNPINGVIVAISIGDILTADDTGIERHVKIIRERIDELIRKFGMVFPVYLVFTKCDLVRGFESFFGDLSEAEREQVWGTYLLDADDNQPIDRLFRDRMDAMYQRLCQLRLRKLAMERNLSRKGELYDFPAQFRAASDKLADFVDQLFRRNPYQETPMLAGVYFTSSTQEGTPLQRALGGMRKAFGLAPDAEANQDQDNDRPFFIKRLFRDVIFQLPGIVRRNRRQMLRQRWWKGAAVATAVGILAATGLGLTGAYGANALLLDRSEERVAAVRDAMDGNNQPMARYEALAALFQHYRELSDYANKRPLSVQLGIYTVDEVIPGLESALFRGLGPLFRDQTLKHLEDRLQQLATRWAEAGPQERKELRPRYYRALETYLQTTRFQDKLALDQTTTVLSNLWARHLGIANADQAYAAVSERAPKLKAMARFYLERMDQEPGKRSWPINERLVKRAREALDTPPNAERLYARIVNKAEMDLKARSLKDFLSESNAALLTEQHSLSGLYTSSGWHDYMQEAIDEAVTDASTGDWVLDAPLKGDKPAAETTPEQGEMDEALAEELRAGIRARYFADYANEWRHFLRDVRPNTGSSLADANALLTELAAEDGPFAELMGVVADNITLYEQKVPDDAPGEEASKKARNPVAELDKRLTGLREFATPREDKPTSQPVAGYLGLIDELTSATGRLSASADAKRDAEEYAARILSGGGSDSAIYKAWVGSQRLMDNTTPATQRALRPLMTRPISTVWGEIVQLARQQVRKEWRAEVVGTYRERLAQRFPFNADGSDASLEDVASFFHPEEGKLWAFIDGTLAPYIEETADGWQGRSWLGVRPGFNQGFFRTLERAERISDALFADGRSKPRIVFHVYPLPETGLSQILLESNGQSYSYRNGPQQWQRLSWPGEQDQLGARVAGRISRGSAVAEQSADGPWGLFHLLEDADIEAVNASVYRVSWQLRVGNRAPVSVAFKLRAEDQAEILTGALLRTFQPSGRLFAFTDAARGRRLAEAR